ncbi:hypothetical protein PVAND_012883 [Polypedilum vanderplanki]|uniref:Peptidase C1A papain C-terminal domain-containing protein n=1 Tax=Polypedilum vanderplanki TaxID=319348 RepID=A0A9J6CMU6_POLVA|nr:hypothetical protein PVAND_012883 [Polypedilum vanderplanki]
MILAVDNTVKTTTKTKSKTAKAIKTTTKQIKTTTTKKMVKSQSMDEKFEEYKKKYNKSYQTREEEQQAKANYIQSEKAKEAHNQRKNETYKQSTTEHSDKSYEWKVKNRMGAKKSANSRASKASSKLPNSLSTRMGEDVPDSVDWSPWCSPIKDQSDCGSCWAFASVAVLEYLMNVIRGEIITLSEQSLVDCDNSSSACGGGWPTYAFDHIISKGIVSNKDYQYLAFQSECIEHYFDPVLYIDDTYELEVKGDEEYLKYLVATYGPIVVVIYATDGLVQYQNGVYYETSCPNDMNSYNHAIVVVGYGTDNTTIPPMDYWLIRNSWSTSWGLNGYGKFARNQQNLCGIANYAMLPSSKWISAKTRPST